MSTTGVYVIILGAGSTVTRTSGSWTLQGAATDLEALTTADSTTYTTPVTIGSASFFTSGAATYSYDFTPPTEPNIVSLIGNGGGVVITTNGVTPVGIDYVELRGTYSILSYTWYYNAATNQYQYVTANPGPPWIAQDPTLLVTIVDPSSGCSGIADVTVTGEGFGDGAVVLFGGVPATNVVVVDQTTITCTVPA